MLLRPWRPHGCPGALEDLVGLVSQQPDRLIYHGLSVIEVDFPATSVGDLGECLAIHDGVGAGLIRRATLDGNVLGELGRPRSQ